MSAGVIGEFSMIVHMWITPIRWRLPLILSTALVWLIGSACAISEVTTDTLPGAAATSDESPPTQTGNPELHTIAPSQTPDAIMTPTPPLPAVITDDFLFDGTDEYCQLPCWQELRIGQSTMEDIDSILGPALEINSIQDLSNNPSIVAFPGYVSKTHQWFFGDTYDSSNLWIRVTVDEHKEMLQGLEFGWVHPQLDKKLYPQRLLQKLGEPSDMLIYLRETGMLTWQVIDILMAYDVGVVFYAEARVPVNIEFLTTQGKRQIHQANLEVCLGGEIWADQDYGGRSRHLFILDLLNDGLENLKPYQEWIVRDIPVRMEFFTSIQEVFGVSLEEVTELAMQEGDACLYLDVTERYQN